MVKYMGFAISKVAIFPGSFLVTVASAYQECVNFGQITTENCVPASDKRETTHKVLITHQRSALHPITSMPVQLI